MLSPQRPAQRPARLARFPKAARRSTPEPGADPSPYVLRAASRAYSAISARGDADPGPARRLSGRTEAEKTPGVSHTERLDFSVHYGRVVQV